MDKTISKEQVETYCYWQSRTVAERMERVAEIIRAEYLAKGVDIDALQMDKTIVRVERTPIQRK